MDDEFDQESTSRRAFAGPYTKKQPVPTIQRYHERLERSGHANDDQAQYPDESGQRQDAADSQDPTATNADQSGTIPGEGGTDTTEAEKPPQMQKSSENPYPSVNKQPQADNPDENQGENMKAESSDAKQGDKRHDDGKKDAPPNDLSSTPQTTKDKQKEFNRRAKKGHGHNERTVTDPVTHLPVEIHDTTPRELEHVPENLPAAEDSSKTSVEGGRQKSEADLKHEQYESQGEHSGMERLFPPPSFEVAREELMRTYMAAFTIGLGLVLGVTTLILLLSHIFYSSSSKSALLGFTVSILGIGLGLGAVVIAGMRGWVANKVSTIWHNQVWESERSVGEEKANAPLPESANWINSVLCSIWPIVNPDLFVSLADTLEDVMQASLPKMVRMVSIDDLGQGSESIRLLGVRWLPGGNAAKSVTVDGKVKSSGSDNKGGKDGKQMSDREVPGEGEQSEGKDKNSDSTSDGAEKSEKQENSKGAKEGVEDDENIKEGMEAEEGDFLNLELAFAYRARPAGKSLRTKDKNAHLYLTFYLPGGITFPVWVELRGIVGTMRVRCQLTPDPPFVDLATISFLGQPHVDISAVPLTRKFLNVMDLPLISSFVQSSINAAMSEYVAPRSLTVDLKQMLIGDDFKKDTSARGVVAVRLKRAWGFKEGDETFGGLKKGSSDPYIAVGWAKFGKPVWSTKVILAEMEPRWEESGFILVGPEELNAGERLKVELWDSDRTTADDQLGRIEVDLKELMQNPKTRGKMCDRRDGFVGMSGDATMPGQLEWAVGYFPKIKIEPENASPNKGQPSREELTELKKKVADRAEKKLRERKADGDATSEIKQQKQQDWKEEMDKLATSSPPDERYPSGIFSIQVHQVIGLEIEKLERTKERGGEHDDNGTKDDDDLPSAYCTVIINQQKVFKTRTKPKNAKPFFNAETEKFIKDWRNTEVIVAVRDARTKEDDALLGVVVVNLGEAFSKRSQISDSFPIAGGIGFGRLRLSMVFRSVEMKLPAEVIGWDVGTLEVTGDITTQDLPGELRSLRLKVRTTASAKAKMVANDGAWKGKHDRRVRLPIRQRYRSCLTIEFRKDSLGLDKTPAFAVFWLKNIPDNEFRTVSIPVWKGDSNLKRAETNDCDGDLGDRVGTIDVPLKFWPGLSSYHRKMASKDAGMQDTMEVMDAANDAEEAENAADEDSESESDNSDDSDDSDDGSPDLKTVNGHAKKDLKGKDDDGHRGPIDMIKEYKQNKSQLHRRHRGFMQWKGPRSLKWMKREVKSAGDSITSHFKHEDQRDAGIETEV